MNKPELKVEPTWSLAQIATAYEVSYSHLQMESARGNLKTARKGRKLVSTQAEITAWWNARHEREADARAGRVARRDQQGKQPRPIKVKTDYRPDVDDDIAAELGLLT